MVGQVLDFAAAQKQDAPAESVRLSDLLHECAAAMQPETDAAGCSVEFHLPPDLPPVAGDRDALRRVFRNLIANAAKHGGAGGWIGLSGSAANGHVSVQVEDRGPGIPDEEQPLIFDPFVRGRAAQEQQIRGSGIGLSLVRQIVHAHGGKVTVRSIPGSGACFTVTLPVA